MINFKQFILTQLLKMYQTTREANIVYYYQNTARIYLDEYKDQKDENKQWLLQNTPIKVQCKFFPDQIYFFRFFSNIYDDCFYYTRHLTNHSFHIGRMEDFEVMGSLTWGDIPFKDDGWRSNPEISQESSEWEEFRNDQR